MFFHSFTEKKRIGMWHDVCYNIGGVNLQSKNEKGGTQPWQS